MRFRRDANSSVLPGGGAPSFAGCAFASSSCFDFFLHLFCTHVVGVVSSPPGNACRHTPERAVTWVTLPLNYAHAHTRCLKQRVKSTLRWTESVTGRGFHLPAVPFTPHIRAAAMTLSASSRTALYLLLPVEPVIQWNLLPFCGCIPAILTMFSFWLYSKSTFVVSGYLFTSSIRIRFQDWGCVVLREIDFLLKRFPHWLNIFALIRYLKADTCKLESSQDHKSRADSSKARSRPRAFNWPFGCWPSRKQIVCLLSSCHFNLFYVHESW